MSSPAGIFKEYRRKKSEKTRKNAEKPKYKQRAHTIGRKEISRIFAKMRFFAYFEKNGVGGPCGIWKLVYNPLCCWAVTSRKQTTSAGVAQLAEHDVANVVVEGSNPFARSLSSSEVHIWRLMENLVLHNGSGECLSRLLYQNIFGYPVILD